MSDMTYIKLWLLFFAKTVELQAIFAVKGSVPCRGLLSLCNTAKHVGDIWGRTVRDSYSVSSSLLLSVIWAGLSRPVN